MNRTSITKEQVTALILNAYGFMCRSNSLYYCHEGYVYDPTFELADINGERLEFSYNNAEICNGSVTFEDVHGVYHTFTILIVPTDGSGIMSKLLQA